VYTEEKMLSTLGVFGVAGTTKALIPQTGHLPPYVKIGDC